MNISLRNKLLSIDINNKPVEGCDRVLNHLQHLFASLAYSDVTKYNLIAFLDEFRFNKDEPLNVLVQRDADEFYCKLLEKLEKELQPLPSGGFLKGELYITASQTIESLDSSADYKNSTPENGPRLALDIKNKSSIEKALDDLIKEEILEGNSAFYCDNHKKYIRASKRFVIESLPNTVTIQLKRFEYDARKDTTVKLNDRVEFPMTINFSKWMRVGKGGIKPEEENNWEYQLVGVVLHAGQCNYGHYISIAKDRQIDSPYFGEWFEFNDDKITPFDVERLSAKAFGKKMKEAEVSLHFF